MITFSIIQKYQLEGAMRLDAEYYQPEYLMLSEKLSGQPKLSQLAKNIICGPFGSAILNSDYRKNGTPLLRVTNLNNDFINCEDVIFIEDGLSGSLKRYHVFPNDIVVSQRGTVAMFSLVTNEYEKYNISANLISILNSEKINFLYLLAFLNSKFGLSQILRKVSGQVQEKITTDDIKNIQIFLPKKESQNEIAELVLESKNETNNSKLFYAQAEKLLLEELDLKDFDFEESLSSIINLSDLKNAGRMDAEYFQVKYDTLIGKLKNPMPLNKIARRKKGIAKTDPGKNYKYIEISDANVESGEINYNVIPARELPANAKIKIDGGELIVSKVRPTRGAISIIPDDWKNDFIASGAFSTYEVPSPMQEYLQVVLRSIIGKLQLERPTTGTTYPTVTDQDVENIRIPILPEVTQQKIAELVHESHEARKKAKELLDEAKRKVEEMIENK